MRHFFVVNPHSFRVRGRIEQVLTDIKNAFPDAGRMDYEIYMSRYSRDAIAAIHRYISKCSNDEIVRVYAVGGDGILFDCLNGVVDFPNAELTSVPYGNTNDFVRIYGPAAVPAFRDIKNLTNAPSRPVDIIHCGGNYALIEVCIGMIGQVVIHANKIFRRSSGELVRRFMPQIYMLSGLKALMNDEVMKQSYTVNMDGEDMSGNYFNIHISNGPCNGRSNLPCPYAVPDDGLLDVIFANAKGKLNVARIIGDYNKGWFEKHRIFRYERCRVMEIKSDVLMYVQMDGETFFAQELKLILIPGGIKFFAPKGLDFADYSQMTYKGRKGVIYK